MIHTNFLPVLILSHIVSSTSWDGPTQTPRQAYPLEFVRIQTALPILPKREATPNSVCGYFSQPGSSLTCRSLNYCGFNSQNAVFGCCGTAVVSSGVYNLYNCNEPSTCYETVQTFSSSNCDDDWVCCEPSCRSDISAAYCTKGTASACVEYQISFPGAAYYGYGCSSTNGFFILSPVGAATTSFEGFGSSTSSTSSTQSTSVITENPAALPTQTTTISNYIAPTETQQTVNSESLGPITFVLPLSTTKAGMGRRLSPSWSLAMICFVLRVVVRL